MSEKTVFGEVAGADRPAAKESHNMGASRSASKQ